MKARFAWGADGQELFVYIKADNAAAWEVWKVSPNADGDYELHAYGVRLFALRREVVELLVRYMGN